MSNQDTYFFRPRKGTRYETGFHGMKTMVLGAYHFCWEYDAQKAACSYYDQCVRAGRSRDFDELCPIYKDRLDLYDGYYRTSLWESVAFYNYIQHFCRKPLNLPMHDTKRIWMRILPHSHKLSMNFGTHLYMDRCG